MNEKVLEVLNVVLDRNRVCSQAMDYVPRPTLGKPGLEYIRSQLKGIAERVIERKHAIIDTYWICGEFTKWSYKSIFADAASGVAEPY
jgi:hypothetical protein